MTVPAETVQAMRAMYEDGATLAEVGVAFDRSGHTVRYLLNSRGVVIRKRGSYGKMKRDTARDAEIAAMYEGGATMQAVATAHGISVERVRQLLLRNGIKGRDRWPIPVADDKAKAMQLMYEAGATLGEVSDEHGLSKSVVKRTFSRLGVVIRKSGRRVGHTYPPKRGDIIVSPDELSRMHRRYVEADLPLAQVASENGMCAMTLRRKFLQAGYRTRAVGKHTRKRKGVA